MIKGKKILITGSNGMIGKNLKEFYQKNNEIIEYTRNSIDTLRITLLKNEPDIIINCAADIYNTNGMFRSNVELIDDIIQHSRCHKIEHFIQIGSSSEYGKKNNPMKEEDNLEPENLYAATKAAATMLSLGYCKEFGVQTTVIRPFTIYGKYDKPHKFFPALMRHFLHSEDISIYNGHHDFLYIKDFISGVDNILNAPKDISNGDIVNLGSGYSFSNREVAEVFAVAFLKSFKGNFKDEFLRPHDTEVWSADTHKVKYRYNFKPKYALLTGIQDYIKEYKQEYGITD